MGSYRQGLSFLVAGVNDHWRQLSPKNAVVALSTPLSAASMQVIPLEVSKISLQVKPSSAGIKVVAKQWFVCWGSGEKCKEARREVRPRSWEQRRNTLWLLMWVHGRGEVLKMRFRYSISPGKVRHLQVSCYSGTSTKCAQLYLDLGRETERNSLSGSPKRAPREAGQMLSLQQKDWQSHDYVFRAVYKFPVPGNDFDNRKRFLDFLRSFSLQPLESFLKVHVWKVKTIWGSFGCNVLIVQAENCWGEGEEIKENWFLLWKTSIWWKHTSLWKTWFEQNTSHSFFHAHNAQQTATEKP